MRFSSAASVRLEVQPEGGGGAEELGEAERGAWGHSPLPVHELVDALVGDMDGFGQVPLRERYRPEKLLQEHLSGVGGLAAGGNSNHRYLCCFTPHQW